VSDYFSVHLCDQRDRQRLGIPSCLDDEMFGLMTDWMIPEGSDGDFGYCLDICISFIPDDHFELRLFPYPICMVADVKISPSCERSVDRSVQPSFNHGYRKRRDITISQNNSEKIFRLTSLRKG
jgi:hypothetical protein